MFETETKTAASDAVIGTIVSLAERWAKNNPRSGGGFLLLVETGGFEPPTSTVRL